MPFIAVIAVVVTVGMLSKVVYEDFGKKSTTRSKPKPTEPDQSDAVVVPAGSMNDLETS
jgi:hypothetical protein